MYLQPIFRHHRALGGTVAADLFAHGLCLPSGSGLTPADRERVIDAILACERAPVAAPPST